MARTGRPKFKSRCLQLLAAVFLLAGLGLSVASSAHAEALSAALREKLPEVEEWVFRNSVATESGVPCREACSALWAHEHEPMANAWREQELWNQLGALEEHFRLWAPVSDLVGGWHEIPLTGALATVGWEMGSSSRKWLELTQPAAPYSTLNGNGQCEGAIEEDLFNAGQELAGSLEPPLRLATESYAAIVPGCPGSGMANTVDQATLGGFCPRTWSPTSTFSGVWTLELHRDPYATCYDATEPPQSIHLEYVTATLPFQFARPEEGSEPSGATEYHVYNSPEPAKSEQTTPMQLEEDLPGYLESSAYGVLIEWLAYYLTGEGKNPTQQFALPPEALFGDGSAAEPERKDCLTDRPVNCATGNETQTRTDLSVNGRGPALQLALTYNSQLAVKQTTAGPFGFGWTGSYSAHLALGEEGREATVYQDNGSTATFTRSGEAWTAPAGRVQATLADEGTGYVYTLPDQTKLHFNNSGQLTSEVDRNGNTLTMGHSGEGRLESVTDAAGRSITLKYDAEGQVESATDPMGHTVKYTYEGGNLASITLPGETSPRWQYKYSSAHELTSETDGRGKTSTTEYNEAHQVISQTDALSHKRSWAYIPTDPGTETVITEPNGSTTIEEFNEYGSPTSVTHAARTALQTTTSDSYNANDELVATTNPDGQTTEYTYNAAGDRTSEKNPAGDETTWEYDSTHHVIASTTPRGEKTTIERDSHGNAIKVSRPAPGEMTQTTKYKYDAYGDLESMTDPLSHEWKYEYNTYGDRTAEIDPEGNKRTRGYNEDSQETSTVSPRGHVTGASEASFTTTIERDAQGRPIKVIDPLKHETQYGYDADGDLETMTDPMGHKTTYVFDADDEPIKVEQPNKAVTETEYNSEGQVTAQTDGDKHTTKYTRNARGEVTEEVNPLGKTTTKEYDPAGNLLSVKDAAGRTTTYRYDPANRLVEVTYSDGKTRTVKYEYNQDGTRTTMVDGTGTTSYTYDRLDRLTEVEDGYKESVKYEYNLNNATTKITYPNGKAVTRTYDKDDRLETIKDWLEHTTKFAYSPDSELQTTTYPTGTGDTDSYAYEDDDAMSETTMKKGSETLASLAYTRNADKLLTKATIKDLPGEAKPAYAYDANSRLTSGAGEEYAYDAANNRTGFEKTTYSYNAADELEKSTLKKTTPFTYTYNEVGERTKTTPETGQATSYGYDQAGNLTTVTRAKEGETPAIEDTYTYNGEGLRAAETISATTSYLTWDTALELPSILDNGTYSFIYGAEEMPIEQINNTTGTVSYLHHDQAGSTRLLTGSTGTVTGKCTYSAYGTPTCEGTSTTPLGYDGQYTSSDTGLQYLRNRVYDPATAQFLTVDPLEAISGAPYNYADDNPINREDAVGLLWTPVAGGAGGADAVCGATIEIPGVDIGTCGAAGISTGIAAAGAAIGVVTAVAGEEGGDEGEAELKKKEAERENCGNPAKSPGSKFEWRGKGPVGSSEGSWFDPDNDESLYPHLGENSHGPHYDYEGPSGNYRIYPEGRIEAKP